MRRLGQLGTRIGILCLAMFLCGCAVGGKSMSIDSTSKSPWFTFELQERKKKSEGPAHRTIRFDKKDKSRVETAGGSGSLAADVAALPKKLALPTTDQSLVLDSTSDEAVELDFR